MHLAARIEGHSIVHVRVCRCAHLKFAVSGEASKVDRPARPDFCTVLVLLADQDPANRALSNQAMQLVDAQVGVDEGSRAELARSPTYVAYANGF